MTRHNGIEQYARCDGTPGYGPRAGPQSFCREHKRAGMFTCRNGVLLVATRDGSGKLWALHAPTHDSIYMRSTGTRYKFILRVTTSSKRVLALLVAPLATVSSGERREARLGNGATVWRKRRCPVVHPLPMFALRPVLNVVITVAAQDRPRAGLNFVFLLRLQGV